MKKLNLATTAAVATVMTASSAYADLSLGGAVASLFKTGDGTSGYSHGGTSYTINVDYTTTLDNGMGLAANVDLAPTNALYKMTFSSDMGSLSFGTDTDSAVDQMDFPKGAAKFNGGGRLIAGDYDDGDTTSGDTIGVSTSVAGASVAVTMGEGSSKAMSIAASMNIAGATVSAGNTDFDSAQVDSGFITVGYSVGGFSLGYNYYDADTTSVTQIGASTSVGGMSVGISSADHDAGSGTDTDAFGVHLGGSLGGAFWVADYVNVDNGDGTESDDYQLIIGTGF
jgi:hypothetical protein